MAQKERTMQVSATEAKNRFEYFCSLAKVEPIVIEKDGRPDTVLVDYAQFQRLKAVSVAESSSQRADQFYRRNKDWVDRQNELIERHGIPCEEYRVW
ncbi:MAG TPA: type II toxin-antitoxin system Phd/YefM family antitoxin [Ramlibacter sp.]|nr:type II toxin-antitoxin system Phd/YefM family antitoxin [Ramlibacter sp.]